MAARGVEKRLGKTVIFGTLDLNEHFTLEPWREHSLQKDSSFLRRWALPTRDFNSTTELLKNFFIALVQLSDHQQVLKSFSSKTTLCVAQP